MKALLENALLPRHASGVNHFPGEHALPADGEEFHVADWH